MKKHKSLSMVDKRKDAIERIRNMRLTICNHLLVVILFGKTQYTSHWIRELATMTETVWDSTFTKDRGRLSADALIDALVPGAIHSEATLLGLCKKAVKSKADLKPRYELSSITPEKMNSLYLMLGSECLRNTFDEAAFKTKIVATLEEIFEIRL